MNLRRKKKIFLCMLFAIMLLNINVYNVKADTGGGLEQGSEASGGSDHQLCPTCKITSDGSYPFGYRIYTTDHSGAVLSRSNVLTQTYGTIKMFAGSKVRSEAAGAGVPGTVPASYKSANGLGFTSWYSGTPANFDSVVKSQLNLCNVGGNMFRIKKADGSCPGNEEMTDPAYVSHMLGVLNAFFDKVGLAQNAEALYEKWKTAANEDQAYIYLAAEGLLSFKQSGVFYAGTCTEHAYWLQAQSDTNQNRVLAELCATATLKNFDGAGYYRTSQFNKSYENYSGSKWTDARTGNKSGGLTSGISTFVWRISDLFGPNKCATLSDQEICNDDNWEDCCSCTKAAQLEAEGKGDYVSDDAKDEYRRTLNYPTCAVTPTTAPVCDYELEVKVPTACATTKSGKVSDKAEWGCIFKSDSRSNDTTVQTNYKISGFSNDYCTIYCQEEINYNMPGSGTTVTAGSWFELGSYSGDGVLGPVSYQGIKTCRPTDKAQSDKGEINLEQFLKDLAQVEKDIIVAWDKWQYAELQQEVINNATAHSWSATCTDSWCTDRDPCPTEKNPGKTCCVAHDSCSEHKTGTYYTYVNKTYYGSTSGYTSKSTGFSNGSCRCTSRCGKHCDAKETTDTAGPRARYIALLEKRDKMIEQIRKCSSFYDEYNEFKPTVDFYYKDSIYEQTVTLVGEGDATSKSNYFKFGNAASSPSVGTSGLTASHSVNDESTGSPSYKADGTVNKGYTKSYVDPNFGAGIWDCGTSVTKAKCTARKTLIYPENKWWEQKTTRTYSFILPDGLNYYIDKPSGYSSDTATENYTYIGKSNLPVHYSTNPGTYDYKVMVTSFGSSDKFTKYVINGSPFNRVNYKKDTTYQCNYTVECQKTIVCTPGSCDPSCDDHITRPSGTDLIYRTISLYYPFPGENATTTSLRAPGWNWQTSMSYDPVTSYIYQNRGVDYYEVYRLDPMYEVNLTPSLMRKIREYNKQQENVTGTFYVGSNVQPGKSISGKLGYSDFTLTCKTDGSGSKSSECTSAVIRSWGVKGCAISGSSGYSNCGSTVAW
ncbi:MAG: hypothetical protein IJ018_02145 [Bacilli bacterium]|nr:hypothetical protein [Bacilli bacterium]